MKKSYIAPESELLSMSIENGILLASVGIDETQQPGGEAWTQGMSIWNNDLREW